MGRLIALLLALLAAYVAVAALLDNGRLAQELQQRNDAVALAQAQAQQAEAEAARAEALARAEEARARARGCPGRNVVRHRVHPGGAGAGPFVGYEPRRADCSAGGAGVAEDAMSTNWSGGGRDNPPAAVAWLIVAATLGAAVWLAWLVR
ncbi:MAG: hypothetical protein KatS3mg050_1842 [Litorilinea sp.]|nr:MAG: hypothetical protein KatS3mg050_1842 [Litorilinea sp.]